MDYREILAIDDVDVIVCGTPDHWHAQISIDAVKAGKDVYCEKPLTLTIEEGKQICKVVKETGRVFQVGTQQRSEMGLRFLQAVALVKNGRIGDVERVSYTLMERPPAGLTPENLPWRWKAEESA